MPTDPDQLARLESKLDQLLENQAWSMQRQRAWRRLLRWLWALLAVWTLLLAGTLAGVVGLLVGAASDGF